MECKVCHSECADGSKFCPKCSARLDGKKICDSCKQEIDEDCIFCPKCGTRLIAKNEAVSEPRAQVAATEAVVAYNVTENSHVKKSNGYATYQKVAGIIISSFLIAALLALFVCSFFMNFRAKVAGEIVSTGKATTINLFKDIIEILKDNKTSTGAIVYEPSSEYKAYCIIFLVVLVANILTAFSMLLVAAIKFAKGLMHKKNNNIALFFSIALSVFAVTAVLTKSFYYTYSSFTLSSGADYSSQILASFGIKCGLIVSALVALVSFVLKLTASGKEIANKNVIAKNVCGCISLLLIVIALALLGKDMLKLENDDVTSGISAGYIAFVGRYGNFKRTTLRNIFTDSGIMGLNIGCWITLGLTVFAAGCAICSITHGLLSDKQNNSACLTSVITSFATSIIYLVLVIIAGALVVEDYDVSCGKVIASVILLACAFASTLVSSIINSSKKTDVVNENTEY